MDRQTVETAMGVDQRALRFLSPGIIRSKKLKNDFESIALSQLSNLYRAAVYFTKNRAEAQDLVQETYLRAFRFLDKFQPGSNYKAWLLSIMRNLFLNRSRKERLKPEMVEWGKVEEVYDSMLHAAENGDDPESVLFSKLMDGEVEKALRELPEEFRTVIVLVDIEELSYEEAAAVMGCPVGTIRSRVSRGRRLLQVKLRDYAAKRG